MDNMLHWAIFGLVFRDCILTFNYNIQPKSRFVYIGLCVTVRKSSFIAYSILTTFGKEIFDNYAGKQNEEEQYLFSLQNLFTYVVNVTCQKQEMSI